MGMDGLIFIYRVLVMTRTRLTAAEKLLLIRVLHLYGTAVVDKPIEDLEPALGMSDGLLKVARDALVDKKLLLETPGKPRVPRPEKHPGGRPAKAFKISDHCLKLLRGQAGRQTDGRAGLRQNELLGRLQGSPHQAQLQSLLFWGGTASPSHQPTLRYATRMLLAALYGLADSAGVVRGIGLGELAQISGMQRQSLEYQLGKLAEEGYLRSRTPGVTGHFAFGQAAGSIFLNIRSQLFPVPELLVCYQDSVLFDHHPFRVGERLYASAAQRLRLDRSKMQLATSPLPSPKIGAVDSAWKWLASTAGLLAPPPNPDPWIGKSTLMGGNSSWALGALWVEDGVHLAFQDKHGEFPRHFQGLIERYASELLTMYWSQIDQGGGLPEEMFSRIRQDMLPYGSDRIRQGEFGQDFNPEALMLYVYILALRLAYWVKAMLTHDLNQEVWQSIDPGTSLFTILPAPDMGDSESPFRLAISVVPRLGVGFVSRTLVVASSGRGEVSCREFKGDFPEQQLYWLPAPGIKERLKPKSASVVIDPPAASSSNAPTQKVQATLDLDDSMISSYDDDDIDA